MVATKQSLRPTALACGCIKPKKVDGSYEPVEAGDLENLFFSRSTRIGLEPVIRQKDQNTTPSAKLTFDFTLSRWLNPIATQSGTPRLT